ncbi:hypothetical protein KR059_002377, partial [Drosophila kikkawai]
KLVAMASNWFGIAFAACLILQLQGILAQMVYPDCGVVSPQSRVVGGQAAGLGSAPFMAYLMKNNLYHCGGSIISKSLYSTFAVSAIFFNKTVRLGEHDNRSNPDCEGFVCMPSHQDFGIARIAYHREYNGGTKFNDIALIKLNGNIIFNVHIQPICLHLYPANARRVTEYQVFGWGLTHYAGSTAHVLQTTNLTHFPNSQCEREFDGISVSNNQFCAGSSTGTDSCGGDSGGPLVTTIETADGESRYVQLGVVSYGDSSCMGTGVYTYAPNYGQWILENIRKMRMY